MGIELLQPKNNFKEKLYAIILCAGKGTRLNNFTKMPKPLIKIESLNNISILNHTINNLINFKIKKIAIVIGYLGEYISQFTSTLLKNNHSLKNKLIIIDAKSQYKLGPLYSFLSITKNQSFFKPNFTYLLIPGDTIFDLNIIEEILYIISKNYELNRNHPFVFYRKIDIKTFKEIYNGKNLISIAEVEKIGLNVILKKISQIKIKNFPDDTYLNQILPLFAFQYENINEILNLRSDIPGNTVWEVLNYIIGKGKKIFSYKIKNKYNFYDIDSIQDLNNFNKKKEEDNRRSD